MSGLGYSSMVECLSKHWGPEFNPNASNDNKIPRRFSTVHYVHVWSWQKQNSSWKGSVQEKYRHCVQLLWKQDRKTLTFAPSFTAFHPSAVLAAEELQKVGFVFALASQSRIEQLKDERPRALLCAWQEGVTPSSLGRLLLQFVCTDPHQPCSFFFFFFLRSKAFWPMSHHFY